MNIIEILKNKFTNLEFISYFKDNKCIYIQAKEKDIQSADGMHIIKYDLVNENYEDKFVVEAILDWNINLSNFKTLEAAKASNS